MNLEIDDPKYGVHLGEYVYQTIKENIVNLNIKPGNRISEKEISNLLNVSRTPVREAFIKLSKEGLLYVLPQRGTYISCIDLEKAEETRFIRESLERSVIKLAAENFPSELMTKLEENLKKQKEYIKEKNMLNV
ncbi:MAG: GntR family transcriptional regulator [Clostridiaceae bacterium]|nr:GntR family transcriptional regulator [Clostridiaceae bacterium]